MNFIQQYGKNRQRYQQNKFTMLYGDYCYIFIDNFPKKFSPCIEMILKRQPKPLCVEGIFLHSHYFYIILYRKLPYLLRAKQCDASIFFNKKIWVIFLSHKENFGFMTKLFFLNFYVRTLEMI